MKRTPAEQALSRLMAYLQLAGMTPTARVSRSAVETVREALEADSDRVVEQTLDKMPQRLRLPEVEIPPPCPPIARSSIGYDP